jgi:hypothetical protein
MTIRGMASPFGNSPTIRDVKDDRGEEPWRHVCSSFSRA